MSAHYLSQQNRGVRHALTSIVPNWLANRPGLNVGFRFLYMMALFADVLIQMMFEGYRAALPGVGTPTALPVLGQSRGILQGLTEPNSSFAARLAAWLTSWFNAGQDEMLVYSLQAFIQKGNYFGIGGPNPVSVTIISRSGVFVNIGAILGGAFYTGVDTNWNWDSISNPERASWWSDVWIIVSPYQSSPNTLYPRWPGGFADPGAQAQWASRNIGGLGIGHQVPRALVDGVLSIVRDWKGAHTYVQAVIWSQDPLLFVPGFLTAPGNPDGTWGNWGRRDPITGYSVASRTRTSMAGYRVFYWTPRGGG